MTATPAPGSTWLLGVLVAAVLTGGVVTVISEDRRPVVETTVRDVEVLPEGQAEITGRVSGLVADDATGAPLALPLELASGTATVAGALVDGAPATIVWDGGRPLRLTGTGTLDLGPAHVEIGVGAVFWSLDGIRVLTPGEYRIDTPVAVGTAGIARPRDSVVFTATDDTIIETSGGAVVTRSLPLHVEGPGTFTADGSFSVRTRNGTIDAGHLEFGPGAFVVDIGPDAMFTAVVNGDLTSS